MANSFAFHGFDEPRRIAANFPEDISGALAAFAEPASLLRINEPADEAYFEIYRADRVSLTSILFSGGDWRWRFCAPNGRSIADSVGYGSERECANAVEALRAGARAATIRSRGYAEYD